MEKTAVDSATEAYYSKYFGPYGKLLTKDIPHRIKIAVSQRLEAKAENVLALPTGISQSGSLLKVEGTYRNLAPNGAQDGLWSAEVEVATGRVASVSTLAAPASAPHAGAPARSAREPA